MGCNCGSSRSASPSAYASTFAGTSASPDSGWSPRAVSPQQEWEVTFPDGTTRVFDTDTEAYREVSKHGGGIRVRDKVSA